MVVSVDGSVGVSIGFVRSAVGGVVDWLVGLAWLGFFCLFVCLFN